MKHSDLDLHARGQARFVDDLSEPEGMLYAAVFPSPVAHGRVTRLDTEEAGKSSGVRAVLTSSDIPGTNQIGTLVADEPLLAEEVVHYVGQPVALVLAESEAAARAALAKIGLEIEELPAVFDPREAQERGELIVAPRTFCLGDVEAAWKRCDRIIEGRVDTGSQEHLYLETQGSLALPAERGGVRVISSTQSPTGVQRVVARILGLSMHQVEVEVMRLGGAFGGKEDQATAWAALAALGAVLCGKPVKLVLHRHEDMVYTGKRHPYSSDYCIGLSSSGKILAYEVEFFQNAGAAADLSPAILERTLFHCTGSYFVPNVKATAYCCRTNLLPNTAFRGFGGPQGMFVMEAALFKAAAALGVRREELQEKNLLKDGDTFPYGMTARGCSAPACWREVKSRYDYGKAVERVEAFNNSHTLSKKGLALMPVCFGISFTNTVLNQGGALVHVYTDGSVSVSTGAVEMGQGVKYKILEVAGRVFSIDRRRVRVESTSTLRVANTSPTAASTGTDLNGKATEIACRTILARIKEVAARELEREDSAKVEIREEQIYYDGEKTDLNWDRLIPRVYTRRINLSAQAHYATPGIHFDKTREKGEPFSYHAYGTALCEVTVDCLRGIYEIDAVRVVHDLGPSLAPQVDLGQAEGGIVQGIGWLTLEEVSYSEEGRLLTGTLSTYKVPDIYHTPRELDVHFLEDRENPLGVFNSKAIGEPPLMYGIGVYYALLAAIQAFRPDRDIPIVAPLTPERVLMNLYEDRFAELKGFAAKAKKTVSR
ncbi:MAG: molybdopterin-dependent oxidoreductase [Spirochaetaceae bacterium]|nr:MAG: molybdopterin-dependent oxidoreductase [Spirochaetaceae bacterium]